MVPTLVSCITPTFGRHNKLPQLVRVFLAQDLRAGRELLIFDDSPSPWSGASWLPSGVRYWHSPKRLTIGTKRNFLTQQAHGDVIVAFDDDDLYAPDYVRRAVEWLRDADFAKLAVFRMLREGDGSEWEWDTTKCGAPCYVVSGDGTTEGPVPADNDPQACDAALWGYGFSYVYRRGVGLDVPFADMSQGEDYEWVCRVRDKFRCNIVSNAADAVLHVLHPRSTSLVFPQKRLGATLNGMTPIPEGQPLRIEPGKRYEAVALLKSSHTLQDLRAKLAAKGLDVQKLEEAPGEGEAPGGYRYVRFEGTATREGEFPWQLPRPWRYVDKTRVVQAWVGAGAADKPDYAIVRIGAGTPIERRIQRLHERRPDLAVSEGTKAMGVGASDAGTIHATMRANARKAIETYASMRPNALALHRVFSASGATRPRFFRDPSRRIGVADPQPICPGTPLTADYQAAVSQVVSGAPTGLPVGGTTLDASLVAQSACDGANQLVNNTTLGFSVSRAQLQTAIGVTVDAEHVAVAMGDILQQVAQNGFDWHSASAVASDASAAVGGIVAILVATGAVTAGAGAVVSAAVGLVVFAVSVLGGLLSKPSPCESAVWTDTRTGQTYPGRVERLCVSGDIIPGPADHHWRAFPTPSDVLFGFGSWFDLPHNKINLKDRPASWSGLNVSSDDDAAHQFRPIDLAFGDYRRLECEAQIGSNHPWVESQGWNAEQKTAMYAFMAYFFEMWKKAAESRLNGLPADWRQMLGSALLHWNMAHNPGAGGVLKLTVGGKPSDYPQQGGDCASIVQPNTPPLFLMMASDSYAGTSLNDIDPGGSPGFFSGQDGGGTYVLLHTGDSRAENPILGGTIKWTGGQVGSKKGLPPAAKIAIGAAATAAVAAGGVGVWSLLSQIGYGEAWSLLWSKLVEQARAGGSMLTGARVPSVHLLGAGEVPKRKKRRSVAR